MPDQSDAQPFPRGSTLPNQSPLFWVGEKDRYLRQLLIRDIEELTERCLIVYYTDCDSSAQIDGGDDKYLMELLSKANCDKIDLLLETNGGQTDATEKVVAILRNQAADLRVIVPKRAKSNGTLLALAAQEIVMGPCSELGPIDPMIAVAPGQFIPAHFIVNMPRQQANPIAVQQAEFAIKQTQKLARDLLKSGMLADKGDTEVDRVVEELSTRNVYHSHGSVIDCEEASRLGLKVRVIEDKEPLWGWFWLLRCMYEHDARVNSVTKIFEGSLISSSIRQVAASP